MKIFYAFGLMFCALGLNAQTVTINLYDYATGTTGAVVNGDTVLLDETGDHYEEYFKITINPATASVVKINVKEISGNSCYADQICGFLIPDPTFQSNCWSPNSTNYTTPSMNVDNPSSTTLLFEPKGSMSCGGCLHMRYTVLINDVVTDSVDLIVCTTLGVKDKVEEEFSMSVYPNPANEYITITAKGTDGQSQIRISDVLGKVVYDETISTTKKIDVSEFKNGVYLVSLIENGNIIKTKRIVVKQ